MKGSTQTNADKKAWMKPSIQEIEFHQTEGKTSSGMERLIMVGPS